MSSCGTTNGTTITGKVYDPAGINPLYNAWVYIPLDPTAALPTFTSGVTCDTCAGAGNLNAVAVTQTASDGTFTLTNVPDNSTSATPLPIVVQMGKWRREIQLPQITKCTNTPLSAGTLRLPRNHTDGYNNQADMPQIAFVSGSADPFECMLLKTGIDPNEFGSSTLNSSRRIHYYNSPDSPGDSIDPSFGNVVTADQLWNNSGSTNNNFKLANYDVVILACEGAEYTSDRSSPGYADLTAYAGAGGRVFLSHFSYVWMKYNSAWSSVPASWRSDTDTQDPMTATVVTAGFPKGVAFSQWLGYVGAGTGGQLTINQGRQDVNLPLASTVQEWMTATDTTPNPDSNYSPSFTFNAPINASSANQCGRVVFSDFHVSTADQVSTDRNGYADCGTNTDCGYGATCSPGALGVCQQGSLRSRPPSPPDCGDSHFTCPTAAPGTCARSGCSLTDTSCGSGYCGSTGLCGCNSNADCGSHSGSNGVCNTATHTCTSLPTSCTASSQCRNGSGQASDATCTGGHCVRSACSYTDCGSGECVTSGGSTVCGCTTSADCGTHGVCNTTTHVCTALGACSAAVDCYSGGGESADANCFGQTPGTCAPNTCTTNSQCSSLTWTNGWHTTTGQEQCLAGTCSGCNTTYDCPGTTSQCVGASPSGTCTGTPTNFPYECQQGGLTPQEAALEFEFFDLSSCVSPDNAPPPAPPPPKLLYFPESFTQQYTANCPAQQYPQWREFDWQGTIPATASIGVSVATAPTVAGLATATTLSFANATTGSPPGNFVADLIDPGTTGIFDTANPPIKSQAILLVTITLNPTTAQDASPSMSLWQIQYDCVNQE